MSKRYRVSVTIEGIQVGGGGSSTAAKRVLEVLRKHLKCRKVALSGHRKLKDSD